MTAEDEWLAETYMDTDYSNIKEEGFKNNVKDYLSYILKYGDNSIEKFIKSIYEKLEKKIITKIEDNEKIELETKNWESFKISDLFIIEKGKEIISEYIEGNIPLISSTRNNNGISAFISDGEKMFSKNKLTLASNGTIGETFLQEKDFHAISDICVLTPKFEFNKYVMLFILTIIKKEKYRYCYGRKFNQKNVENTVIKLPAKQISKENFTPDFEFMENYIKNLSYSNLI